MKYINTLEYNFINLHNHVLLFCNISKCVTNRNDKIYSGTLFHSASNGHESLTHL